MRIAAFEAESVGGLRADQAPSGPACDGFEVGVLTEFDGAKQRFVCARLDFAKLSGWKSLVKQADQRGRAVSSPFDNWGNGA